MALKKEEERRMEEADEIFYTREDNQVNIFMSSSSSDEKSAGEEIAPVRKPSKSKPKRPTKKQQTPKMVRGRGRGRRGLSRADMKRKRAPSSSEAEESSASVYVDDEKSRDGDPLWREYEQEIAGLESDGFYSEDDQRWMFNYEEDQDRFSDQEMDFPEEESSPPYRESPLWKVAAQSERLLHETPPTPHVDYGPNEIMSFSKSGRPRKRNKRFCDDEFEVFSPGSAFSEPVYPPKPQNLFQKTLYNVVIETTKKKPVKVSTAVPAFPQAPVVRQVAPPRLLLPFSLVSVGSPVNSVVSVQSQLRYSLSTASTVFNTPLQNAPRPAMFVSRSSFAQPVQLSSATPAAKPVLVNVKSQQIRPKQPLVSKQHDNLFELDFTLDNSFDAENGRAPNAADDQLITLNLEPVDVAEESFFEPSNEEERNVFESFASLL